MSHASQAGRPQRRLDWSHGPIPCADCGRPMRPSGSRAGGVWEGTVGHARHGICSTCDYRRDKQAAAAAGGGEATSPAAPSQPAGPPVTVLHRSRPGQDAQGARRYVWERALPVASAVPRAHWVAEAYGAVARTLRERRLVLTAPPDMTLVHGRVPRIRCVCPVRPMTDTEAASMARHGMQVGDPATEEEVTAA